MPTLLALLAPFLAAGAAPDDSPWLSACLRLQDQALTCKEPFVDRVIELRAKVDPEFAAKTSSPEALAEARRVALEETEADAKLPRLEKEKRCLYARKSGWSPNPKQVALLDECLALDDCEKKIACLSPLLEQRAAALAPRSAAKPEGKKKPASKKARL